MGDLPKYDQNGIPTTAYMDGILTQEDWDNRHRVMAMCHSCEKWTEQHYVAGEKNEYKPCEHCGNNSFDPQKTCSLRTWNPNKGKKVRKQSQFTGERPVFGDPRYTKGRLKK